MSTLDRGKLLQLTAASFVAGGLAEVPLAAATKREAFQRALLRVAKSQKSVDVGGGEVELVGMTSDRALALLGRPDFVHKNHPDDIEGDWCYGVAEPGGLPTLGYVSISDEGRVRMVYGAWCDLPPLKGISEPELRRILTRLDTVPDGQWANQLWNPAATLRALELLWPLGRERLFSVTAEYLRVGGVYLPEGVALGSNTLWVLFALLFTVPGPVEGLAYLDFHKRVFVDGVPISFDHLYGGGRRMSLDWDAVEAYRREGVLNQRPGPPPDNPLRIIEKVERLPEWPAALERFPKVRQSVMDQLMRLVAPVFRPQTAVDYKKNPILSEADYERWPELIAQFDRLNATWDRKRGSYVLPGGKTLPNDWPPTYHNWRWQ